MTWAPRSRGEGAPWIVDAHVSDIPLSRKLPLLIHNLQRSFPGESLDIQRGEESRLSNLMEDMNRARVAVSLVVLSEETGEFLRLAGQYPNRLFGLASYDPLSPRQGLDRIQELREAHPNLIVGVTAAISGLHQDPRLKDFAPLYEYCVQHDLPIQFCPDDSSAGERSVQPTAFAVLARTYPRLKVVCRYVETWDENAMEYLRRFPNLFLQVAGLPQTEGSEISRCLQTLLRRVGSRKMLFASDWRGRDPTYFQQVETVRRLPWWQRCNIGWRTAVRLYGLRMPRAQRSAHNSQPWKRTIRERLKADR